MRYRSNLPELKNRLSGKVAIFIDIRERKGGPRFHIAHALHFHNEAVVLQAHMPAVHPEISNWRVKGVPPPIFLWLNLIFLQKSK